MALATGCRHLQLSANLFPVICCRTLALMQPPASKTTRDDSIARLRLVGGPQVGLFDFIGVIFPNSHATITFPDLIQASVQGPALVSFFRVLHNPMQLMELRCTEQRAPAQVVLSLRGNNLATVGALPAWMSCAAFQAPRRSCK